MTVAGFRLKRVAALTSGSTQDITVSGMGTVKAYRIVITSAVSLTGTTAREHILSWGVCDGTFQGGVGINSLHNSANSTCGRVGFDDAVIRLPNANGSGFAAIATHNSFITDGIRINWSTNPGSAYIMEVELWYGANLSVKAGSATPNAGTGASVLVNTGFRPDFVMTGCANAALNETISNTYLGAFSFFIDEDNSNDLYTVQLRHLNNAATMVPTAYMGTGFICRPYTGDTTPFTLASGTALDATTPFDSSGFNIRTIPSSAGTGPTFVYLALEFGGKAYDLQLKDTPTSTGNNSVTGLSFRPGFVTMLQSIAAAWGDTQIADASGGSAGFGAFNMAGEEGAVSGSDQDAAATSNTNSRSDAKALHIIQHDGVTTDYAASFVSFNSDGYTLNFTTVQGTAKKYVSFMLEHDDVPVTPTGIASAQAFGTATLTAGVVVVTPSGIASAQAFGTPSLLNVNTLSPSSIASAEAFGTPSLTAGTVNLSPSSIASAEAFGTPSLLNVNTLNPSSIASAEAFGTPSLSSVVVLSPSSIASAEAFGTASLAAGTVNVSPSSIASAEAFGTASLSFGVVNVSPSSIASAEAFGTPSLLNVNTLSPSSITSDEAFGTPSLTPGTVTIIVVGIASDEAFGTASLSDIPIISPSSIASAEAFGTPTLTGSSAVVFPFSIESAEAFGIPVLALDTTQFIIVSGIASGEALGHPFLAGGFIPVTLKKTIHDALCTLAEQGTFIAASYDSEMCELVQGLQIQPASVEANEIDSAYAIDERHGSKFLQDFTQWQWLVIVRFHQEAICEPWVRSLLEDPPCLARNPESGNRQIRLLLLDTKYEHPPREGASNGTLARFRFQAELSPR